MISSRYNCQRIPESAALEAKRCLRAALETCTGALARLLEADKLGACWLLHRARTQGVTGLNRENRIRISTTAIAIVLENTAESLNALGWCAR